MITNSRATYKNIRVQDTENTLEDITVLKYGTEPSFTSEEELTSSPKPYRYYNPLTAGYVYLTTSVRSSSTNVVVPSSTWFVNATSSKTLVYPNPILPGDLTRVSFIEEKQPQYVINEQYKEVFRRVGQLVNLPDNWDSYGGKPITENCINDAFKILQYILDLRDINNIEVPAPFVAPLSSGGLQIEWEEGDRYLQIDLLSETSEIEYFAIDKTNAGDLSLEGAMKSLNDLKGLLIWFTWGETEDLAILDFENFDTELAA